MSDGGALRERFIASLREMVREAVERGYVEEFTQACYEAELNDPRRSHEDSAEEEAATFV
jgi:hypothetical protein